jgi:molybdopterin converting factor small subunit
MPVAKIPPVLRSSTGGAKEVAVDGTTVGDALRSLAAQHPGTERQLFGDGGELNRYVNVYKNDEDVRVLDGLETQLSDSDTLMILPAMAGGCGAPGYEGWMPSTGSERGHGSPRS